MLGLRAQTAGTGEAEQIQEEAGEAKPGPGLGEPMDVGNTVLFLASDAASYITGALVPVDAGYTAM